MERAQKEASSTIAENNMKNENEASQVSNIIKKHDKEIKINSQTMHKINKKTNENDIVAADEGERFEQNSKSDVKNDEESDSESGEEDNGPFVDVMPFSTKETYEMRVRTVNEIQCFFCREWNRIEEQHEVDGTELVDVTCSFCNQRYTAHMLVFYK